MPYEIVIADTSEVPRLDWLTERRKGVGSADAAPSLRMSPWTSDYTLYCDKLGLIPDREDTETFWWGRTLEPLIINRWAELYGYEVQSRYQMLRSTQWPWMLANPDAIALDRAKGERVVVEAKTADSWNEREWDEGIPDHYAVQATHLMAVTGLRTCILPVLFGGHRLREFVIERDEELIGTLVAGERTFWQRVLDQDAPEPDGSESTMYTIRGQFRESTSEGRELPLDAATWIATFHQYGDLADTAAATRDAAKQNLMLALGAAEVGTLGGDVCVTWKADKNGKRTMRFPKSRKVA